MRRFQLILGAALLISSLWCYGGREKASPPSGNYPYDIATEITVSGTVEEMREYQCPVTGTVGSHMTLKTEKGTIEVHLAPAKFLKDYEITIRSGDAVKLVAAQITYEGKPALLAKTVTINKETFAFRSAQGHPLW